MFRFFHKGKLMGKRYIRVDNEMLMKQTVKWALEMVGGHVTNYTVFV